MPLTDETNNRYHLADWHSYEAHTNFISYLRQNTVRLHYNEKLVKSCQEIFDVLQKIIGLSSACFIRCMSLILGILSTCACACEYVCDAVVDRWRA